MYCLEMVGLNKNTFSTRLKKKLLFNPSTIVTTSTRRTTTSSIVHRNSNFSSGTASSGFSFMTTSKGTQPNHFARQNDVSILDVGSYNLPIIAGAGSAAVLLILVVLVISCRRLVNAFCRKLQLLLPIF